MAKRRALTRCFRRNGAEGGNRLAGLFTAAGQALAPADIRRVAGYLGGRRGRTVREHEIAHHSPCVCVCTGELRSQFWVFAYSGSSQGPPALWSLGLRLGGSAQGVVTCEESGAPLPVSMPQARELGRRADS